MDFCYLRAWAQHRDADLIQRVRHKVQAVEVARGDDVILGLGVSHDAASRQDISDIERAELLLVYGPVFKPLEEGIDRLPHDVAEANEEIEREAREARGIRRDETELEFFCACGRPDCDTKLLLTLAEYEAAQAGPRRFIVAPGHVNPALERVVEELVPELNRFPDLEVDVLCQGPEAREYALDGKGGVLQATGRVPEVAPGTDWMRLITIDGELLGRVVFEVLEGTGSPAAVAPNRISRGPQSLGVLLGLVAVVGLLVWWMWRKPEEDEEPQGNVAVARRGRARAEPASHAVPGEHDVEEKKRPNPLTGRPRKRSPDAMPPGEPQTHPGTEKVRERLLQASRPMGRNL